MGLLRRIHAIYERFSPSYYTLLKKELRNCRDVVDFGCGDHSPIARFKNIHKVGLDIHEPTIKRAKVLRTHDEFIKGDVLKFRSKEKFDCAVALDVIEHVDKQDGNKLIENMEASADKVIIFTPNGYLAQDKELVKHNPWQEHLSGWSVDDFKRRGYKVYGVNGLKILRGERANIVWKPRIFWFIISELSQWITVFFPRLAFQLLAVKKR